MLVDETYPYRLPKIGERIEIQGLQAAAQHNGAKGRILSFTKESGRYAVQLLPLKDDKNNRTRTKTKLAIQPKNLKLLEDPKKQIWDDRLIHVLVPCHVNSERRKEQFRQCARSLVCQTGQCRIFVGVSGSYADQAIVTL